MSRLLMETGVSCDKRRLHKVIYFADLISSNEVVGASIRPLLSGPVRARTKCAYRFAITGHKKNDRNSRYFVFHHALL